MPGVKGDGGTERRGLALERETIDDGFVDVGVKGGIVLNEIAATLNRDHRGGNSYLQLDVQGDWNERTNVTSCE